MPWRSASGSFANATAKPVLQRDQAGHRVRARAVHADLAVVIDGHERERRVDLAVDDLDVETVDAIDRLPVVHGSAAERIDAELQSRRTDRLHVDDVPQVLDVRQHEVLLVQSSQRVGALASGTRFAPRLPSRSSSLARF